MQKDPEQLNIEFNNRARKIFFALYSEFENGAASIDRLRDENVFQQLQSQYVYTLKQQLEGIAKELIGRNKMPEDSTRFAKTVPSAISGYTTEFTQKVRAL